MGAKVNCRFLSCSSQGKDLIAQINNQAVTAGRDTVKKKSRA